MIVSTDPTNNQFLRIHIEAVIRHIRTANRMEGLVAHLAELARRGICKVWALGVWAYAGIGGVVLGTTRQDEMLVGRVDDFAAWPVAGLQRLEWSTGVGHSGRQF